MINKDRLPKALKKQRQWVCWKGEMRGDKETKIPVSPAGGPARVNDASTWASLDRALYAMRTESHIDGIGFVFTDDDPFVGVDLDECRTPETGELTDQAQEILSDLTGYREVSPSGTGLHIICRGEVTGRSRSGNVEMYDDDRYFTVTGEAVDASGNPVDQPAEPASCQQALDAVHAAFVGADNTETPAPTVAEESGLASVDQFDDDTTVDRERFSHLTSQETAGGGPTSSSSVRNSITRGDGEGSITVGNLPKEDVDLLEKAVAASNGALFVRLFNGQYKSLPDRQEYESQSEADMALCDILAFWTGSDPEQMDRIFRESELHREKWDTQHYSNGRTYGEMTIRRAVARVSESYDADYNSTTSSA